MTKKNAVATSKNLDLRCDDAYLFACKVGAGVFSSLKAKGNWTIILSLLLNLIEDVMRKLKSPQHAETRELLCLAILKHLTDDLPAAKSEEILSDKQRNRRIKHNEAVISQLEAVL